MSEDRSEVKRPSSEIRRGRNRARLTVFGALSLAFATLVVANYCASLLYARWQFDADAKGGLSSRTLEFLQSSQGEIKITALFEKSHPFHRAARNLLQEYAESAALIPGLDVKTAALDVNHDLAATSEMMRRFPVELNSILVEYGQQYQVVNEYDMVNTEFDRHWVEQDSAKKKPERFNGESACTTAMMKLLHPVPSLVYFVEGHGEYDPDSHHQITGASATYHSLSINGIQVKKLNLEQSGSVPPDCDVLVIAGPRIMYGQHAIEIVSSYLARGGKAMILIDDLYASGLTTILENWGLQVTALAKHDLTKSHVSTALYGKHPITKRLDNIMTFFANPCRVETIRSDQLGAERADKPQTTRLVLIPTGSSLENQNDQESPVSIAAASEIGGATLIGQRHNTRLVVCGDSDFISNAMNQKGFDGNTAFMLSAMEWLIGRSGRPASEDDAVSILKAGIDPDSGWFTLGILLCAALPALVLAFGLLLYNPLTRRL